MQFWLVVVALVVGFAAVGYAVNKWALKSKFDMKLAIGVGAALGAAAAGGLWYMTGKKAEAPLARAAPVEINREGEIVSTVTPEAYIDEITAQE